MVNKDRVRLWVKALKSGDYEQGIGALRVNDTYCCLGVACEVAIAGGLEVHVDRSRPTVTYDGADGHLPESVQGWFGFFDDNPDLGAAPPCGCENNCTEVMSASVANDDRGWTFLEIAKAVEDEYLDGEEVL